MSFLFGVTEAPWGDRRRAAEAEGDPERLVELREEAEEVSANLRAITALEGALALLRATQESAPSRFCGGPSRDEEYRQEACLALAAPSANPADGPDLLLRPDLGYLANDVAKKPSRSSAPTAIICDASCRGRDAFVAPVLLRANDAHRRAGNERGASASRQHSQQRYCRSPSGVRRWAHDSETSGSQDEHRAFSQHDLLADREWTFPRSVSLVGGRWVGWRPRCRTGCNGGLRRAARPKREATVSSAAQVARR